jgi:hypothetical protein
MSSSPRVRSLLVAIALIIAASATAQTYEQGEQPETQYDATVAPLTMTFADDFAPAPEDAPPAAGPSVGAYVEVSDHERMALISPAYSFTPSLRATARIPWITERKRVYWDREATASGLGDIAVDLEYTRDLAPGQQLRLLGSVKLPTGDQEKEDDGYAVPLGTGSVDVLGRVRYTRSTWRTGLTLSAMYRVNGEGEVVREYIASDPTWNSTTTTRTTAGNQLVLSAFGRHRLGGRWWLNLGVSMLKVGDGEESWETEYADGSAFDGSYDLEQRGTLVDLFPGVSAEVGPLTPYLGVRVPLSTSWDNEFLLEDRDTAVVFQVSYKPERLGSFD